LVAFRDVCSRATAACRVEHEVAGIGGHQEAAGNGFGPGLNDIDFVICEVSSPCVWPKFGDGYRRKIVDVSHILKAVCRDVKSIRIR
jgi:hypothetical protein